MKRQTEAQGIESLWEPEVLDVDPFVLPARYKIKCGEWSGKYLNAYDEVYIGSYSVLIRRHVLGDVTHQNRLSLKEFQGVSIRVGMLEAEKYKFAVSINLQHEKLCYSVPLYFAYDLDVSVARVQSWSKVLKLPILTPALDGTWQEPLEKLGRLLVKPAIMRNPRPYLASRKSLASAFRDVGELDGRCRVRGREMIARE